MNMTLRAGTVALAMAALLSQATPSFAVEVAGAEQSPSASINIARIKSALKLTPEQLPHWPAVERALRDLERQHAQPEQAGFVRRLSNKVVSIALSSSAIQRLAVAARPLMAKLDTDQKLAALGLAKEMGLGSAVAALN
jgi:hypothetical protein